MNVGSYNTAALPLICVMVWQTWITCIQWSYEAQQPTVSERRSFFSAFVGFAAHIYIYLPHHNRRRSTTELWIEWLIDSHLITYTYTTNHTCMHTYTNMRYLLLLLNGKKLGPIPVRPGGISSFFATTLPASAAALTLIIRTHDLWHRILPPALLLRIPV